MLSGPTFEKAFAMHPEWPRSALDYRYNDEPLAQIRLPHDSPLRPAKRAQELLILALALGVMGERDVRIEDRVKGVAGKQESPDFFVALSSGREVGAEVAQLTDELNAASDRLIEKLQLNLTEAIEADVELKRRYASVSISFQMAIREQRGYNSAAVLNDLLNLLRENGDVRIQPGSMIVPSIEKYPALSTHSVRGQLSERYYRWIAISPHIFTNANVDGRASLSTLIDKKTSVAYDSMGKPLWLILGVTDPLGQFTFDLESFMHMELNVGPFEKIILTNGIRATSTGSPQLVPAVNT